jgi:hypothetical protein
MKFVGYLVFTAILASIGNRLISYILIMRKTNRFCSKLFFFKVEEALN